MSHHFAWNAALILVLLCATPVPSGQPDWRDCAREADRLLTVETSSASGGEAVPLADDETYLRRVFLDLVGKPPSIADVASFAARSGDKRAGVVDELLDNPEFGRNWARYWRDVIMYRRTEERALVAAESLTSYLSDRFNENAPWSQIVTELITASGDVRENGATGLIMAQAGMPEDVTAEVSRIFLGIQIQCAQCHDHPTDRWKREQFHQLAAFFPRIAVRPDRTATVPTFLVTVNDQPFQFRRPGNDNRFVGTPEHYMPNLEDPSDRGRRMQPIFFLTGKKLIFGTPDSDRRGALAEWITATNNPWFAKAFVNRLWAELVGEGFYQPVDDLGPDRQCSAPQTLDHLASQFAESGYDVKWLFRTVMATDAYQRVSRPRRQFDAPSFQANCPQRLRPDQLFDALLAALEMPESTGPRLGGGPNLRVTPRVVFSQAFGFDPSDPRDEVSGSIQQALAMMNSPTINQAINARRSEGLGRLLREYANDQEVLEQLYVKTLSRHPSPEEMRTCLAYLKEVGNRQEAFEDILWSLVNTTEFLHRK